MSEEKRLAHIAELERENARLDEVIREAAAYRIPPKKRELFKPPILEKRASRSSRGDKIEWLEHDAPSVRLISASACSGSSILVGRRGIVSN